jgi:hypothetical protein
VAFLWVVALIEYQRLRTLAQLEKSESWLHTLFKILPAGISLV